MTEVLKKIIQFIFRPKNRVKESLGIKRKLKNILIIYLFNFIITLIIAILIKSIFDIENIKIDKIKNSWSIVKLFFIGVLLVPISEEIIFRLSLVFKPIYIALSSFFLFYIVISSFYFHVAFFDLEKEVIIRLVLSGTIGLVIYLIASKYSNTLKFFWANRFRFIFYLSIILFGFFHIGNYPLTTSNLLIFPLLTLPQIVSGSLLGYIRITYGFIYSCLFHIMLNFIPLML